MHSEPSPLPNPFIVTISKGSLWEIHRVQLFSSPQQIHADKTNSEPTEKERLDASSTVSRIQAIVTRIIATQSLRVICSWNSIRAIMAVATISKLFSNDAFAAAVVLSPSIRNIGAAISRTTIEQLVFIKHFRVG